MPIDYSNGKIYTIRCRTDDTLIYVGSTCQSLSNRFSSHKKDSKKEERKNILLYQEVNGNWDNWYIELYEDFPCERKEELLKTEGEIIRLISNLNKQIAGRSREEWNEDNKEIIAEKKKEYYENNKKKINEYQKHWREDNKETIHEYRKQFYEANKDIILEKVKTYNATNKEKKKEYDKKRREDKKDILAEQRKQYYEDNKEKRKEKIICSCGCEIRKSDVNRHQKSKKHLDLIQSVN